tara:strand:- start:763 stop:897 length:135 start_codon:yes stop_codon:yes gene_type:complete
MEKKMEEQIELLVGIKIKLKTTGVVCSSKYFVILKKNSKKFQYI